LGERGLFEIGVGPVGVDYSFFFENKLKIGLVDNYSVQAPN
jgi:hypothetical protein